MNIDQAHERLCEIIARAPAEDDGLPISSNESCTRLHLIDPILTEVLGWPRELIHTEQPAGEGDGAGRGRLDYVVYGDDGTCWFVLEAKRVQDDLLVRNSARSAAQELKLSGPILKAHAWPIIDKQMPAYLGRTNPNYAILTNGEQWIGFLHRLRPANLSLDQSEGLVFRSFETLQESFEAFYDAFAYPRVRDRILAVRLSPERVGYVACATPERIVPLGQEWRLPYQGRGDFYHDLRQAMRLAFQPILDDPDALAHCLVDSTESHRADERLERMAAELQLELGDAGDYADDVGEELDSARDAPAWPQGRVDALRGQGYLARLLGEPSSGKSVFLRRLFTSTLAARDTELLLIWLDGEKLSPFDPHAASREAITQVERALFGPEGLSLPQYKELYRAEWRRELASYGLTETDAHAATQWRTFLQARQREQEADAAHALRRLLDFALQNRQRLPIVVVDNVDHVDQADAAIRWTLALYPQHLRARHRGHEGHHALAAEARGRGWPGQPQPRAVLAATPQGPRRAGEPPHLPSPRPDHTGPAGPPDHHPSRPRRPIPVDGGRQRPGAGRQHRAARPAGDRQLAR